MWAPTGEGARATPLQQQQEPLTLDYGTEFSPESSTLGPLEPQKVVNEPNSTDATHVSLMAGGVALLLLLPLLYTIYRCRKRGVQSYENIPDGSQMRKRNSRCSQASIHSCNQKRPIDFVLPNIPPTYPTVPSPVLAAADCISIASSDSSDMPLWARLALLEPGPTLLGGLNPELYRISIEQPEEEVNFPEGNVGRVWISLQYDSASERLSVNLIKAKNLPSRAYGCTNCCDPLVRIFVLPDERRYVQSKTKKKTSNPQFDENFVFQIPSKSIEERTLKLTVLDNDRGKRYNVIGHSLLALKEIDLTTDEVVILWKDLIKDTDEVPSDLGELMVSLCYNENLARLTVTVCEARNMKLPEGQTTVDSFVKLILMQENKVVKTKKTMVVKKATDPKYNESFHFRLQQKSLGAASVILQVTMSNSGNIKDKILGRIVFGSYMFVRGKPLEHWNEAISANHKQIRHWHKLTL